MTRHMFMDPAFPDLVAATASEQADELDCSSPRCSAPGTPKKPETFADLLRLLARLW
jgi:hypothetical protein